MGVKEDALEVEQEDKGSFYVSMVIRNRLNNFRWELITVYGPANHAMSSDFISELSRKCLTTDLPLVIGGDFNMIREAADKSNGSADNRLMENFNFFIDLHQLREIKKSGSKYTWTNKQDNPILSNIDRILVSTDWEKHHPLSFAWCKTRVGSDHWPLLLDSGEHIMKRQKYFFF